MPEFTLVEQNVAGCPEGRLVAIGGPMTVEYGAEIRSALARVIETAPEVRLDLGEVTEIDLVGLQLLCSAHRTALARSGNLTLALPLSAPLAARAAEAGFAPRSAGCIRGRELTCLWLNGGE